MRQRLAGAASSTNLSTIATFFGDLHGDWTKHSRFVRAYVSGRVEGVSVLKGIHRRIVSRGAGERLGSIAQSRGPLQVQELLPALQGFSCWDGGYVRSFLDQVRTYLPAASYRHLPMYSMSTETIETVPVLSRKESRFAPLAPDVLYEFIEEGKADVPANLLRPHHLSPGRRYSMIVTDGYGLERYQTEDLFECAGTARGVPDLRFVRRRNLAYSFTGEKLTGEHLKLSYQAVEARFPEICRQGFLTCFPSKPHPESLPTYRLVFVQTGESGPDNWEHIASHVEERLAEVNMEFAAKIASRRLGRMTLETVRFRDFVRRLTGHEQSTAWESQFKFLPLYPKLWEASALSHK